MVDFTAAITLDREVPVSMRPFQSGPMVALVRRNPKDWPRGVQSAAVDATAGLLADSPLAHPDLVVRGDCETT